MRKDRMRIKGHTVSEKFDHLEIILSRMCKRLGHRITGIIPPSPLFHYVDQPDKDGIILRGILPMGEITKLCLAVGKYNTKKFVRFTCKLEDISGTGYTHSFETHKQLLVEEVNLSVTKTGFFTLRVEDSSDAEKPLIEQIWITALFQFDVKDSKTKEFLLDELEELEEVL